MKEHFYKYLIPLFFILSIIISGCKTSEVSEIKPQKAKSPDNLYSELKISSDQFSGMTANGIIAIEGDTKMSMNVSAIFLKVLSAYFNENSAKIAIHYNSTKIEEKDFYTKANEMLKATLTPELLISLFKGTVPDNINFKLPPEPKGNGNTLYTHLLSTGVEYFLLDKEGRLVQYQQKSREESKTISFIYSDYKLIDGKYEVPQSITIKIPEIDFSGKIQYSEIKTTIPKDYKFDFVIPSSYKAG